MAVNTVAARNKILVFVSEDFYLLSHRANLLAELVSQGFDVTVVTNIVNGGQAIANLGVKCVQCDVHGKSLSPLKFASAILRYGRIVRQERADLLFAVALKPIVTLAAARVVFSKVPALYAFAGLGTAFAGNVRSAHVKVSNLALRTLFRLLLRKRCSACLFQNLEDRDLFTSKGWIAQDSAYIIPGAGVALKDFGPKHWDQEQPVNFLFAGRLLWEKGVEFLVDAARILKSRGLRFRLRVAGLIDQCSASAVPEAYMKECESSGLLEWLGPRKDIPELLQTTDCFVFPSIYREGIPKVLLEASAAGVPMIASDIAGCRAVVEEDFNGKLVEAGDSEALARTMAEVIEQRERLPIWGKNARDKAEREYDVEKVIEAHLNIFEHLLRLGKQPSG